MIFYKLDYVVEEIKKSELSCEQKSLKKFAGQDFNKQEAEFIWERVSDHKWYLGERLKRDVGTRVAAIDYIENFYETNNDHKKQNGNSGIFRRLSDSLAHLSRAYFISKSKIFAD